MTGVVLLVAWAFLIGAAVVSPDESTRIFGWAVLALTVAFFWYPGPSHSRRP